MTELRWGASSDVGRVRGHNEDAYLATPPVFAVADGMGGHGAGEVASALAVRELAPLAGLPTARAEDVTDALARANDAILAAVTRGEGPPRMGTTVAGAVLVERGGLLHWLVFNVGDSRVYRCDGDALEQLSVDHSVVEELVLAGEITRAQARVHPGRHVVTRALGSDPPPRGDQWLLPAAVGDRLLVCSDGLFGEVEDSAMAAVLREPDPQRAAEGLVAAACAAGGHDNVTAVVVDLVGGASALDGDTLPRSALAGPDGEGAP